MGRVGYLDLLGRGLGRVVDGGIKARLRSTSIPHAELLKSLSRRINDRHLLGLIKMWLEAAVEEVDKRGRPHRTIRDKDEGRGSPQGSPLTPPTMLRNRP